MELIKGKARAFNTEAFNILGFLILPPGILGPPGTDADRASASSRPSRPCWDPGRPRGSEGASRRARDQAGAAGQLPSSRGRGGRGRRGAGAARGRTAPTRVVVGPPRGKRLVPRVTWTISPLTLARRCGSLGYNQPFGGFAPATGHHAVCFGALNVYNVGSGGRLGACER